MLYELRGPHFEKDNFVHTTAEKFENATLFLRFGLQSTLIRHENGAFRKRSSNRRNLKTHGENAGFSF